MTARFLAVASIVGLTSSALAQTPSQTGTGAGPRSTITAPNTTTTGQTKPPGAAGAPSAADDRGARNANEKKGDAIDTGICIGCNK